MIELDDRRRRIRDDARVFVREEVLPVAAELDPRGEDMPWSLVDRLGELGYLGATVPEEHGGLGFGMVDYCILIEELARGWLSVASVVGRGNRILEEVLDTDELRRRYLPRIARGELICAFALSEAEAGSDVANVACRAVETADGWRIVGEKRWCGFAWRADAILLFARTDDPPADAPHRGISAFLIEKDRESFPEGLSGTPIDKIGYHGLTTWELTFDGLALPSEALMGERGEAFYGVMAGLDRKRVYTAARAVGLARGALEDALAYATQREQFDHQLADFQSIRFMLADMATSVEAARALTLAAADALDRGGRVDREAAMAKLFATEVAERVTRDGMQIHGGNGYISATPAQRYWRDARLTTIFEGTSEIQRRIIADRLVEDGLG
ncbi:MAG: acyl-CoA dehydrogenase family protein [Actinobacteria bacterium]|nr:acyl-CoA dehydrogenase family protein [Actinomycetota bacterium]